MNKKKRFTISLPVLKPLSIPKKNKKTIIQKLSAFIFETKKWEVLENWHYKLNDDLELIIPKGFCYEGKSIPKYYWVLFNPTGLLLAPAILHEYGCQYNLIWQVGPDGSAIAYKEGAGRIFWDDLFKKVVKSVNGRGFINVIAWIIIAIRPAKYGSAAWEGHIGRTLNSNKPEKPVLIN